MAGKKSKELRPLIKLRSTAGTGYTYVTRKNRRNTPDRLSLIEKELKEHGFLAPLQPWEH